MLGFHHVHCPARIQRHSAAALPDLSDITAKVWYVVKSKPAWLLDHKLSCVFVCVCI